MPATTDPGRQPAPQPAWQRWAWFAGLWAAGAAATAAFAYALRAVLPG